VVSRPLDDLLEGQEVLHMTTRANQTDVSNTTGDVEGQAHNYSHAQVTGRPGMQKNPATSGTRRTSTTSRLKASPRGTLGPYIRTVRSPMASS
jgi:hypothetical protein